MLKCSNGKHVCSIVMHLHKQLNDAYELMLNPTTFILCDSHQFEYLRIMNHVFNYTYRTKLMNGGRTWIKKIYEKKITGYYGQANQGVGGKCFGFNLTWHYLVWPY